MPFVARPNGDDLFVVPSVDATDVQLNLLWNLLLNLLKLSTICPPLAQ